MTTNNYLITPSPELVQQWLGFYFGTTVTGEVSDVEFVLATQAARWGADAELKACCADIHRVYGKAQADWLRSMRRPKPPSLKEQALHILDTHGNLTRAEADTIRRALEQLDD